MNDLISAGVFSKVPEGTPLTWLHNMVVTGKSDGTPRITVDLQKLNAHLSREKYHTESPSRQARSVPRHTVKTVFDVFHGFYTLELAESSRHYTTFQTELGPLQYNRGPQGCSNTGDVYSQRYDELLKDVQRRKQYVDDSLLYDPH